MSEENENGNGDEFNFYFSFTKPLVLDLPSSEDRAIAAAWVQKLEVEPESEEEKEQRLNYLKLLLFVLQRGRLSGIFKKQPPSGPLQPFPQGFSILDMGNLMLDQDDGQVCGGGDARLVPYSIEISNDLREFVASQEIPNFGIQMYYAWSSDEPIHKWASFDEDKFPQFILDKIKQLKALKSDEKFLFDGCVKKKKGCDYPIPDKFSKKKVKSPQEVERSQGRSFHTYVGLVRGMGNFNEKCNDDQDRCQKQDQRQGKPQARNVQRRCPGNGGEAEDMAPEEEYDTFVSGLGGLNAQNKPCLCPFPCHHQDCPEQQRGGPQSFEEPPPNGSGRCRGRSGSANIPNNIAVPSPMQTRRRGEPCPQPESDFTMTPQRCMPTPQSRNNSPNRLNMDSTPEDMNCPPKQTDVCVCSSPPCTCPCPRSSPARSPPSNANSTAMKPCGNLNETVTKSPPKDPRCAARLPGRVPGQYVGNTSTPNSSLSDSSPTGGRTCGNTLTKQELDIIHCYDKRNPDPYLIEKGDTGIPTPSTGGFSPGTPIYMPPTDMGRARRQLFTPLAQSTFIEGCTPPPTEMSNEKYCSPIKTPRSPELGSHYLCDSTPEEVQGPCMRGTPSQLPPPQQQQPPCPRQQPPCPQQQPPCPPEQPPCPRQQPPCPRQQPPCPRQQPPCPPEQPPCPRQQTPCPPEQPPCPRQQPPCPQQQPPCPQQQPPCPAEQPPCPRQQPPCPQQQPPCPSEQPPCPRQQPPCSQQQQQYSPADETYLRQPTDTYKKPAPPSSNKQVPSNYAPCGTYAANTSDRLADMANMLQGMKQKTEAHREKCGEGAIYRSPRPEGNAPCYSGSPQSKSQVKSRQVYYDEGAEPGNAQMNTSRGIRGATSAYSGPCSTPQQYSPREDCPASVGVQNRGFIQQTPCPPQQMQQQSYSPWQMQQQLRTPQQMQQSCPPQRPRSPPQLQQPCPSQQFRSPQQMQQRPCSPQKMQQQQQPCPPQQQPCPPQQQSCPPQQMQQQVRSPQQMQQQQPCPSQQMPATIPNQDCYPPPNPDICVEDCDDDSTCYRDILMPCHRDLTQDLTDTTYEDECPSQCGATLGSDDWYSMPSTIQSSRQSSSMENSSCLPSPPRPGSSPQCRRTSPSQRPTSQNSTSGNRSAEMQTASCAPQNRSPMQNANNQAQINAGCRPAANMQYSQMKGGCPAEYSDWSNSYPEKPNVRYGQPSQQRCPGNGGNAGAPPMGSRTRFLDVSNGTYGTQQQRCPPNGGGTGPQTMSPGMHARRLSPGQHAAVNFDDSDSQLLCQPGNGLQEMRTYPPQQRCPSNGGQAMVPGGQYDNQMDSHEGSTMLFEDDSSCDPQMMEPEIVGDCFVEFLDFDDTDYDPPPARQT